MLVDIDEKNGHEFIIDELDEEHILVKETKVAELKQRLQNVRHIFLLVITSNTALDDERAPQGTRKLRLGLIMILFSTGYTTVLRPLPPR